MDEQRWSQWQADFRAETTHFLANPPTIEPVDLSIGTTELQPLGALPFGGLLRPGLVHSLTGAPESGKTLIAMEFARQAIRNGGVAMWIDEEGGRDTTASGLRAIGFDTDDIECFGYYPFPGWDFSDEVMKEIRYRARMSNLVVIDSVGSCLAAAGLNEIDNRDVTTFFSAWVKLADALDVPVLMIDHKAKAMTTGPYAVGAGAKLRMVHIAYSVKVVSPFSRDRSGSVRLTIDKDRTGTLSREPINVAMRVTPGKLTVDIGSTASAHSADSGLKPAERKALEALRSCHERLGRAVSQNEVVDEIAERHGHGLKRPTISAALNELARRELADRIDGGVSRPASWLPRSSSSG